jgi:hypothetical protein
MEQLLALIQQYGAFGGLAIFSTFVCILLLRDQSKTNNKLREMQADMQRQNAQSEAKVHETESQTDAVIVGALDRLVEHSARVSERNSAALEKIVDRLDAGSAVSATTLEGIQGLVSGQEDVMEALQPLAAIQTQLGALDAGIGRLHAHVDAAQQEIIAAIRSKRDTQPLVLNTVEVKENGANERGN